MTRGDAFEKPGRRLFWVFGAVFVACVAFLTSYYQALSHTDELMFEFAKAAIQIGVISLAGTIIDFLVSGYERRLAQRRYQEDLLKSTLSRITASYNRTKAARRQMRARGLQGEPPDCPVRLSGYDDIMGDVIDAQLELEAIKSDVGTSKSIFPSAKALEPQLTSMESYLNKIVGEYEDERGRADDPAVELRLNDLNAMSDFVAKAKSEPKPRFITDYADVHSKVRQIIRNDLIELAGGKPEKTSAAEPAKGTKTSC